jgi:hypothetical protein
MESNSTPSKVLLKPVRRKQRRDEDSYALLPKNYIQQADLLFMKPDGKFKYILVVVDQNRICDATPMSSKASHEIVLGFKRIYKHGIISYPKTMQFDAGGEFNNAEVLSFFKDQNIKTKTSLANRHNQTALVEAANFKIAKKEAERAIDEEYITGESAVEWAKYLPGIVTKINQENGKVREKLEKKQEKDEKNEEHAPKITEKLYRIGDKVRIALDAPSDIIGGGRLSGKFRIGDARWSADIKTIDNMFIKMRGDKKPIVRYTIVSSPASKNDKKASYTGNQLQLSRTMDYGKIKDIAPHRRKKQTLFIAEKVLGEKDVRGKKHYVVKFRGHDKPQLQLASAFEKLEHNRGLIP